MVSATSLNRQVIWDGSVRCFVAAGNGSCWSIKPFWGRVWCLRCVNWSLVIVGLSSKTIIQVYQRLAQGWVLECPWVAISASGFKSHWKSLTGFETSGGSTESTKCQWAGSFSHEQWAKSPIERCRDPLNTCQKHLLAVIKGKGCSAKYWLLGLNSFANGHLYRFNLVLKIIQMCIYRLFAEALVWCHSVLLTSVL